MATDFPTSLDSYTDKTNGDTIQASHVNNLQDAVAALEAKVGIDSSAVATSLDYIVSQGADPGHTHTGASLSSIPETDITDGAVLARVASSETISGVWTFNAGSILDKGSVVYDVKAYGAAGDGSTDDTTSIQNAINAAATAGGGTVYFPEGTYVCSTLTWKTNVYGVGDGMQASILKLKASTDDDLIKGENFATLTAGDTVAGIHDFGFRDIKLDGNKDNNAATSWVVRFYGYRPFFENVWIANGNDGGIYSQGFTSTDPINGANRYGRFANIEVSNCGGDGIYFNGIGDSVFSDCVIHDNTGDGIQIAARGLGTKLIGCHIYGNAHDHCVHSEAAGVMMVGCVFEGSDTSCVWLDDGADNNQVKSCYIYAAGTQTSKIGVEVDAAETFSVVGNHIVSCTDAAVKFTSDGGSGYISANYIYAASGDAWGSTRPAENTVIGRNRVVGGATGGDGGSVTISSGRVALSPGENFVRVAGEGATTDTLDHIQLEAVGTLKQVQMSHAITLAHNTASAPAGYGPILCPGGSNLAVAQYAVVTLICDNPNWVVVE